VRTQETVNYSLSETVSHIIREPGTIKRLSVAVLTDSAASADVDAAALQAAISAALGIDAARGDQVSVSSVPFASAPDGGEEPPAEPAAPQIAEMLEYAKIGGALLFALLLLLILWRSARGVRRRAEEIAFGVAPEAAADPRTIVAQVGGRASDDDPGAAVVPNPHIVVQERLRELAQQRPEQVAGMASQWLNGED
jgi:flagellar M-ring protein FliF